MPASLSGLTSLAIARGTLSSVLAAVVALLTHTGASPASAVTLPIPAPLLTLSKVAKGASNAATVIPSAIAMRGSSSMELPEGALGCCCCCCCVRVGLLCACALAVVACVGPGLLLCVAWLYGVHAFVWMFLCFACCSFACRDVAADRHSVLHGLCSGRGQALQKTPSPWLWAALVAICTLC